MTPEESALKDADRALAMADEEIGQLRFRVEELERQRDEERARVRTLVEALTELCGLSRRLVFDRQYAAVNSDIVALWGAALRAADRLLSVPNAAPLGAVQRARERVVAAAERLSMSDVPAVAVGDPIGWVKWRELLTAVAALRAARPTGKETPDA